MIIIEPKVVQVNDFEGVDNFYKSVARAARICYASEKNDDDIKLIKRLVKSRHFSPFAHAIVYLDTMKCSETGEDKVFDSIMNRCLVNPYTIHKGAGFWCILNGRVIVEACEKVLSENPDFTVDTLDLLDSFLTKVRAVETDKLNGLFKSFIVDTSIGCTREMNRHHDCFYICEQSTRYCNFSKDKFGKEVSFNKPYWFKDPNGVKEKRWQIKMMYDEFYYFLMLDGGFSLDEARGSLNLDTHTRAIYTAIVDEWDNVIDQRYKGTTGKPHGDIAVIAGEINKLIND